MVTGPSLEHALIALWVSLTAWMAFPDQARAGCETLLPQSLAQAQQSRTITGEDLIELRDIGQPDASLLGHSPLALSPDGQELSFIMTRADPVSNTICRGVVVLTLADGKVRLLDHGGEPMTEVGPLRGYLVTDGFPALVWPVWSPDGKWVAYLRKDQGLVQAWRAKSDGSHSEAITHSAASIEAVTWSRDGQRLIVASRPKEAEIDAAITREADKGWLYDARIIPERPTRPLLPANLPREIASVALADGSQMPGSAEDVAVLDATLTAENTTPAQAIRADGARAWTERMGKSVAAPLGLRVQDAHGQAVTCPEGFCRSRIIGLWWETSSGSLLVLRKEGWDNGRMGLYRWRPGHGAPRRILATHDWLGGCIMAQPRLVCMQENARMPRRIVSIDPANARENVLFQPNPQWSGVALGDVQRLELTNVYGLKSWGDLVLPVGYQPGQHVPLIIVQYHSDGFLRGGTGDDYPIFLFAAHGFAVLSLERPNVYASLFPNLLTPDQLNAANQKDWGERKSLLSSLKAGVEKVIAMGVADPARLGITGLSDGATTARFALINYPVFAAAAISTCCVEPQTAMVSNGTAWADWLHDVMGYPRANESRPDFWQPASLVVNAAQINTPLLMQIAGTEHHLSLEAFTALREAHKPVEMYVFPNEHHIRVEPIHRLNTYRRSLDWFEFWLQGTEDPDPAKRDQYRRWEEMRANRQPDGQTSVNPMNEPTPLHPPVP